jgi:hypothetical protein
VITHPERGDPGLLGRAREPHQRFAIRQQGGSGGWSLQGGVGPGGTGRCACEARSRVARGDAVVHRLGRLRTSDRERAASAHR